MDKIKNNMTFNLSQIKENFLKLLKRKIFWLIVLLILIFSFCGFLAGVFFGKIFIPKLKDYFSKFNIELFEIESPEKEKIIKQEKIVEKEYIPQTSQEENIIKVVKETSPAVVSIIISKDLPVVEQYFYNPFKDFEEFFGPSPFEFKIPQYRQKENQKQEIGGGTGFIISKNGLILTNKHVVLDEKADYTVLTNDGKKIPAKVLAKNPVQDIAILKIPEIENNNFSAAKLGNSDQLQIGQTVIAIGNALGEFRNTVSVGVISGLGRTISASGQGMVEVLEDVIQTDAAINQGNSGGPLLNLKGEIIGINSATVYGAQNIGFAIPINKAKKDIEQIQQKGKISYPFLGVRYLLIDEKVQKENNLARDYGAWIVSDKKEPAIYPGSPAEKVGLKENDIILEFNNEKITSENSLAKIISKYNVGDKIIIKILREKQEKTFEIILDERI